jgi:hypothetical protein
MAFVLCFLCSSDGERVQVGWTRSVVFHKAEGDGAGAKLLQVLGRLPAFVVPIEMDEVSMMARQAVH